MFSFNFPFVRMIKKYTKTHEWIDVTGKVGKLGISSYLAHHLGEITWVTLNPSTYKTGEEIGSIEASKKIQSITAPCDLRIIRTNKEIESNPKSLVLSSEGKGWLAEFELTANEPTGLLDRKAYINYLSTFE